MDFDEEPELAVENSQQHGRSCTCRRCLLRKLDDYQDEFIGLERELSQAYGRMGMLEAELATNNQLQRETITDHDAAPEPRADNLQVEHRPSCSCRMCLLAENARLLVQNESLKAEIDNLKAPRHQVGPEEEEVETAGAEEARDETRKKDELDINVGYECLAEDDQDDSDWMELEAWTEAEEAKGERTIPGHAFRIPPPVVGEALPTVLTGDESVGGCVDFMVRYLLDMPHVRKPNVRRFSTEDVELCQRKIAMALRGADWKAAGRLPTAVDLNMFYGFFYWLLKQLRKERERGDTTYGKNQSHVRDFFKAQSLSLDHALKLAADNPKLYAFVCRQFCCPCCASCERWKKTCKNCRAARVKAVGGNLSKVRKAAASLLQQLGVAELTETRQDEIYSDVRVFLVLPTMLNVARTTNAIHSTKQKDAVNEMRTTVEFPDIETVESHGLIDNLLLEGTEPLDQGEKKLYFRSNDVVAICDDDYFMEHELKYSVWAATSLIGPNGKAIGPCAVDIVDFGRHSGIDKLYWLMERGEVLDEKLIESQVMPKEEQISFMAETCRGVCTSLYLQSIGPGIIHRDIKEANMVYSKNGVGHLLHAIQWKGARLPDLSQKISKRMPVLKNIDLERAMFDVPCFFDGLSTPEYNCILVLFGIHDAISGIFDDLAAAGKIFLRLFNRGFDPFRYRGSDVDSPGQAVKCPKKIRDALYNIVDFEHLYLDGDKDADEEFRGRVIDSIYHYLLAFHTPQHVVVKVLATYTSQLEGFEKVLMECDEYKADVERFSLIFGKQMDIIRRCPVFETKAAAVLFFFHFMHPNPFHRFLPEEMLTLLVDA